MDLLITVGSSFISDDDIKSISNEQCSFESLNYENFDSNDLVLVLISLISSIGQNAIYDCLKTGILSLLHIANNKARTKSFEMLLDLNGRKYSIEMNVELSDMQVEKIVDAAIKKLLE